MDNAVAGVIMKHASVQITRGDEMPNFICQLCDTQLEKTHQFLTQIEQSDKTLRRRLQELYALEKPVKAESAVQSSNDNLFHSSNKDITVKCESLELNDIFDMGRNCKEAEPGISFQETKNIEELYLKSEIKVEPIDANLFLTTECETDSKDISSNTDDKEFSCEDSKTEIDETKVSEAITMNWKENEQENRVLTNKFIDEMSAKVEKKVEQMDDNLSILTGSVDDTENTSYIGKTSKNSCLRSVTVTENSSKYEETNKNISKNRKEHKKANKFTCNICNKCFSGHSGLNYHKRAHTGKKPHQCVLCNKCFTQSSDLIKHKRIHTGEKPYQCDLCNKCFSQSSHLKIHNLKHTGEKPYQCNICQMCFTQSCQLNNHKRIHTVEKLYQCNLSNDFSHSSSLKHRKLKPTAEKPYQCHLCNKCFSQSTNLSRHKRTHTGGKLSV